VSAAAAAAAVVLRSDERPSISIGGHFVTLHRALLYQICDEKGV